MIEMMQLDRQHKRLEGELRTAVESVVESCQFIKGEAVGRLENSLAGYLGCKHVVSCGNGTDALYIALRALSLPEGSEVITTTMSFVAAAEAVAILGYKPVFADVDETYNINAKDIERHITTQTKAIIATHLFGRPCDMQKIMDVARKHNLYVIEDAAQAMGGWCKVDGERKMLGSIGDIGCTSFFPSKNLGCWGDGGAAFTNNETFACLMRKIANHGGMKKYAYEMYGINSRLDTIQAAVLEVKLRHLDEFNAHRRWVADRYRNELGSCRHIVVPKDVDGCVYHQFTVRVKDGLRDSLKEFLNGQGVKTMVYYPQALHLQGAYKHFAKSNLAMSEMLQNEVLSLPICSETCADNIDAICKLIYEWEMTN